jgi:hypothetical protein
MFGIKQGQEITPEILLRFFREAAFEFKDPRPLKKLVESLDGSKAGVSRADLVPLFECSENAAVESLRVGCKDDARRWFELALDLRERIERHSHPSDLSLDLLRLPSR